MPQCKPCGEASSRFDDAKVQMDDPQLRIQFLTQAIAQGASAARGSCHLMCRGGAQLRDWTSFWRAHSYLIKVSANFTGVQKANAWA